MTADTLKLLVVLLGGGLGGALIAEVFRWRRGRTRAIPVIERVNRNPVASELRGIKLFRVPTQPDEAPTEINNLREYQLTLRNTSGKDLRGAEIQFEFSSEDVEPWVSRPVLSKTAITSVAERLAKHGLTYGPESRADRFEIFSTKLISPEFAQVYTTETWYLTAYRGNARIQACAPNFDGGQVYELRKIAGNWLIQAESGVRYGPADCAIRSLAESAR